MPNAKFTSGGSGAIKDYELTNGTIRVTGTKDPGASLTVTLQPSGRQKEVPASAPDNWAIDMPASESDTSLLLDGPGDKTDSQDVRIRTVVVKASDAG